jgi:hypothetical protein
MTRGWVYGLLLAALAIGCTPAFAEPPGTFARRLASAGSLFHDQSSNRRENVFYTSGGAFPRLQARAAWLRSPGHRANLPMLFLRVSRGPNGTYVVGRK